MSRINFEQFLKNNAFKSSTLGIIPKHIRFFGENGHQANFGFCTHKAHTIYLMDDDPCQLFMLPSDGRKLTREIKINLNLSDKELRTSLGGLQATTIANGQPIIVFDDNQSYYIPRVTDIIQAYGCDLSVLRSIHPKLQNMSSYEYLIWMLNAYQLGVLGPYMEKFLWDVITFYFSQEDMPLVKLAYMQAVITTTEFIELESSIIDKF